jgi:hypothetical protein
MSSYCTHRPSTYGAAKLPMLLGRWENAIGDAVRRYGPRAWEGVPTTALLAMSANVEGSRPWTDRISAAGFWEIGIYNTPAGNDISRPPPSGGAWVRIANAQGTDGTGPSATSVLGRRPTTSTTEWDRESAIPDQVVIGVIDYRESATYVTSRIPSNLRPTRGTQWDWVCGVFGYVTSTGAVQAINQHAAELARFDESRRYSALLQLVAADFQRNGVNSAKAYPLVRAWQRLECGRELAIATREPKGWYSLGLGSYYRAVEHQLTRARYGAPSNCQPYPGYDAEIPPPNPDMVLEGADDDTLTNVGIALGSLAGIALVGYGTWHGVRYARARLAARAAAALPPPQS